MEIALTLKGSLKIKGKHASFVVDPKEKSSYDGVIVLNGGVDSSVVPEEAIVVYGPGEYEVKGVKMSGIRSGGEIVFNMRVDGVGVLLGKLSSLEKMQHKLNEQDIVVVYVDFLTSVSFITSLASSVVIFYGAQAKELVEKFGKGNVKTLHKYSAAVGKLPQEVETMILQ